MFACKKCGSPIIGTSDTIPGTALGTLTRNAEGKIEVEWQGGMVVNWDGQTTNTDDNDLTLYVCDGGCEVNENDMEEKADAVDQEPEPAEGLASGQDDHEGARRGGGQGALS